MCMVILSLSIKNIYIHTEIQPKTIDHLKWNIKICSNNPKEGMKWYGYEERRERSD